MAGGEHAAILKQGIGLGTGGIGATLVSDPVLPIPPA